MTTRSFWLVCGCLTFMLLAGLMTTNSTLILLASPLIIYLAAAVLFTPVKPRLKAYRTLSTDRVTEGMDITIDLKVENRHTRIDELHLSEYDTHDLEVTDGVTSKVAQLQPGEAITYQYTFTGKRGSYSFENLQARVSDPFGLFDIKRQLPTRGRVLVYPSVPSLRAIPIRPPQTKGFSGPIASRKTGAGMDFFGVRQYRLGDPLRKINWRTSEKHRDELFTNEYEQEQVADVCIILDARPHCDISFRGRSLFEYSVLTAASFSKIFLDSGHCISMLVYAAVVSRIFPGYGKIQYERILSTLAHVETGFNYAREHLNYIPARLLPPGGQLVYISPLTATDLEPIIHLRNLGYAVLVVSPDPIYFEQQAEPDPDHPDFQLGTRFARLERSLLLNNLRQAGIEAVSWSVDQPLTNLVEKVRVQQSLAQRKVKVLL